MNGPYFVGAYWNSRRESADECAYRLEEFLRRLSPIDKGLSRWYEPQRTLEKTLKKPIHGLGHEGLVDVMNSGRNRLDSDHSVVEDLGFQRSFWNARQRESDVTLLIRCGCYWQSPSPSSSIGNCALIEFPHGLGALVSSSKMRDALAATVQAWEPEWAGVISEAAMFSRDFGGNQPFVDWMVYVPQSVETVPPPSTVTVVPGHGSIIVVQPEPPSSEDAEALGRIEGIKRRLKL